MFNYLITGYGLYGDVIFRKLIKYILLPMLTVILFYKKRNQKLSINKDLLMYFGFAAVENAVFMSAVTAIVTKAVRTCAGIGLSYIRCYVVIGTILSAFVFPKLLELFFSVSSKFLNMNEREVAKEVIDHFFLLVIAIVCFGTQIGLTTFYFNFPDEVYEKLYFITCLAAIFKAILVFEGKESRNRFVNSSPERKNLSDNKGKYNEFIKDIYKKNKNLLFSIPVAVVLFLAFPSEHYPYQQFLAPLIIGCVGIRIRKIFMAAFIPSALVIIVMIFASLEGAIYSMAIIDRNIRSYWGHISPTDLGTAVLMIVCFFWILFKDIPEEVFIIPAVFSLFISFYVTRSNTSGYLTILLMLMFGLRVFGREVIEKKGRFKRRKKIVDIALMLMFPVLGVLILLMVYAYYKELPFAGRMDSILHYRLFSAADMLAEHGINPFGTYFEMYAYGGSTLPSGQPYTFIDSSYPQIFIRYGYITYLVANILWAYTMYKALESGNRRVAYVMAILAVDFVMEHHWYELSYNVFILIPFANFSENREEKTTILYKSIKVFREKWKDKKFTITFTIICICQLIIVYLILPIAFSRLRTIFNGCGLSGGERNGIIVFVTITVIMLTTLMFIWNLSGLVASLATDKDIRKVNAVMFVAAFCIGASLFMAGDILIKRISNENKFKLEEEREILELVTSEASGKVYADKLPEIYIRNVKGISRSYFCGEDFARYDIATVISDASWDSQCLFGRGFLYLPISEDDAIYTNDDKLIESLKRSGYKLKGYNPYEYTVNLELLARKNMLNVLPDGGIKLKGREKPLMFGPYLELYDGEFTVKYSMKLSETDLSPDDKICNLRVSSFFGKSIRASVDLYRRDFDKEGNLEYEVPFNGGGQGYEFLIFTEDGTELEVSSISYKRTPDKDTHSMIDSKGRVTRVEYYDLNGDPLEVTGGYYGSEYSYDNHDLPIMQRYLGRDFKAVVIKAGYAEVHREYNDKKQVIKESYYGIDSEPVELPEGYHSVEKEYDFSGNCISERYYDLEGKPVMINGDYYKYFRTFNSDNRWIRTEFYDKDNKLNILKAGYAAVEREYDEAGNAIEERYYGTNGKPALYYESYHKYKMQYNDNNQCIRVMYYGLNDEPLPQSGNYAGYDSEYDKSGNIIKHTYIGTDGKPTMTEWGYATWRRVYNTKKQVIREEYYDISGNRMALEPGQFAVEYEYDDLGNTISDAYYGINDERILITNGYWKVVRTYNEKHQIIHEEYFDIDELPILISEKYTMVDFIYGENDKLTKYIYKDIDGNVVDEQMVE